MDNSYEQKERSTDARLVSESKRGDRKAYGRLVQIHSPRVYSIAYSVLSDFQAAQDIAQEAFVRAYQKLKNLRNPESFGTWVDTIGRNLARRALQKRRGSSFVLTDFSDTANHPSVTTDSTKPEIQEAINSLPDMYREPLVMRYLGGVDYEEIAEKLGTSRNTIEVRVYRAKKMLRETLAQARER